VAGQMGVKSAVRYLREHSLHIFVLDGVDTQHNSPHACFDSLIFVIVEFQGSRVDREDFDSVIEEEVDSLFVKFDDQRFEEVHIVVYDLTIASVVALPLLHAGLVKAKIVVN